MSSPDVEKLPWDRLENEGAKAFVAFCAYRDMGPDRSIAKAYRALSGRQSSVRPPRRWAYWSSDFEWKRRAEEYDLHLELKARAERESQHSAELEAYRKRQQNLATATTASSLQLLSIVNQRMVDLLAEYKAWKLRYDEAGARIAALIAAGASAKEIAEAEDEREELKKRDPLAPASIPNYLRAAAAVAQVATDAEAQALAVNELLKILEDTKTKV